MSIRLRLTLLYSAILALTLVAFSTFLYVAQSHLSFDSIKTSLVRQSDAFASGPRRFPALPGGARPTGGAPPGVEVFAGALPDGTLLGRWTQTRGLEGAVNGRTLDLSDTTLPLSERGLETVQHGLGWFETAQVDDQPLLIYSRSYARDDGTIEILQMAYPIAEPEQSLRTLRLILVIGCSVVTLAAFAIGWVLSGTALRPIHRITQTARSIGAERNFSHRVPHTGPADEVGELALTLNDMLAQLETAYRQLEGALDSQRRFVADASHELRTPLTTVRGNIELLRRELPVDAKERADILADTTDEVERLIRLVNQLLVLARADAGQVLRPERLPVKPLLEDVYRQAKLLAPRTAILCDAPQGAMVLGDRDALKQVLLILVDNALVHTSPGAEVAIGADVVDGRVAIRVRDTGPGIPPGVLPHIFERFYRGEVSRSGGGAGLGLSIAKDLVEAQDGTIAVESQIGQGSIFTITLPLAPAELSPA